MALTRIMHVPRKSGTVCDLGVEEKEEKEHTQIVYQTRREVLLFMAEYTSSSMILPLDLGKEVSANFDGGTLSSDAGLLLLAAADARAGVTAALATAVRDRRQQSKVAHSAQEILRARVLAIAGGYVDGNDLDTLRDDPVLKMASGHCPVSGAALASQPTVSRWENQARPRDLLRLGLALAERVVAQLPADTQRVVLDVDASDDPCHGQQQFEGFNGYYDTHCYLPLFVHLTAAGTQWPLAAVLRPGRTNPLAGVCGVLKRAVRLLRARFPEVEILVRADSGFGCDEVLSCCERLGVHYLIGLPSNRRLQVLGAAAQARCAQAWAAQCAVRAADPQRYEGGLAIAARGWTGAGWSAQAAADGTWEPCREYASFAYKAGSWAHCRPTLIKVEMTQGKLNPRYVVTDLTAWAGQELDAAARYDLYCGRGQQENGIKESKLDLDSGRTSCHRFLANQARLLEHLAAHVLWTVVRVAAAGTAWAKAQVGTLRLQIQKVAVRVRETTRRIWLHLCSTYPAQAQWRRLWERLQGVVVGPASPPVAGAAGT